MKMQIVANFLHILPNFMYPEHFKNFSAKPAHGEIDPQTQPLQQQDYFMH